MVAPIDAKATFQVEGETITLRLNFRTFALAETAGMNLFAMNLDLTPMQTVKLIRCLSVQDHPDMTEEEAFAIAMKDGEAFITAFAALYGSFAKSSAGGNVKRTRKPSAP